MSAPSSHDIQVDSLRLHYVEAGTPTPDTPPILLVHGFPTSSHLYRNVIPELAGTRRVLALDLPGYGLSDKPLDVTYDFRFYARAIGGFLDALGIDTVDLVVHDLGGPAGLYWAVENPDRVRRIVALNTLVYPQAHWSVKLFLLALRAPLIRDYVVSPSGIVGAMKFGVVHKDRLNRQTLTPYTAPFETKAARQALIKAGSGLSIGGLAHIAKKLPTLGKPLRIIYGEKDFILPDVAKTMARLAKDIPGTEVTALPDCGHFLQEDDPKTVAKLIAQFFA